VFRNSAAGLRQRTHYLLVNAEASSSYAEAERQPLNSAKGSLDLGRMQEIGKYVVMIGVVLVVAGVILWRFPSLFGWMGKLPGDISVQKGNFSFYFPVLTCILVSIVLTLLSWLFRR
jgi:Protein of unknown function (DUF2905)